MSYGRPGNYFCNQPSQLPPKNNNGERFPAMSFGHGGTHTTYSLPAKLPPINNNGYEPLTPTLSPRATQSATWRTISGALTMNELYTPCQYGPPGLSSQHELLKSYGAPKPSPEPLKSQMASASQRGFMQSYDIPQSPKDQFRAHMGFPTQPGYEQSYAIQQPLEAEAQPWKNKWRQENTPKPNVAAPLHFPAWLDPYAKKHQDVLKKDLSYDDLHFLAHHRPDPEAVSVPNDLKDVAWGLQNAHRSYMECTETPCPALLKKAQIAESRFLQRKEVEKAMERDMLRMSLSVNRMMSTVNIVEGTRRAVAGCESVKEADHGSGQSQESNETWIPHF